VSIASALPVGAARGRPRVEARAVWLYTYVFRGTPLYVQLLLLHGLYSLQIVRGTPLLDAFFRTDAARCSRSR
jgi:histidine transport system permease protein